MGGKKNWLIVLGLVACIGGLAAFGISTLTLHADEKDDKYYMVVFAYQGNPNLPRLAQHVRDFCQGAHHDGKPDMDKLEAHTISWITDPENFGLLKRPAVGKNLSLEESLQWAVSKNCAVFAFGPYPIKQELYDRAMAQLARLNRGDLAYKATDRRFRASGTAVNCFHAISDMVDGPLLETGAAYGEPASAMVRDHLAPWIIEPRSIDRSPHRAAGPG